MTSEGIRTVKALEAQREYAPKYYVAGTVRANDIETAGSFAEYLYFINAKTVKHIKTVRAVAEGRLPKSVVAPLHIYWFEGIGYAEAAIKDEFDAADFNDEYCGITSDGYNHAVDFNGFFSEKDFDGLIWQIKELAKDLNRTADFQWGVGTYKSANKDCSAEFKVDPLEDDEETGDDDDGAEQALKGIEYRISEAAN